MSTITGCLEVRQGSFETLADRWEALLGETPGATPFLTPTWQKVWWDRFGTGAELRLVSFSKNGEVAGLAPLMQREGVVSFLGDTDLVDYHDVVSGSCDVTELADALFASIDGWPGCKTVDLRSIPADSPTLKAMESAALRAGWDVEDWLEDVAPGIALPGSFEVYVQSLGKKDRHELRRKLRRLKAAGDVQQAELSSKGEIEPALPEFFRLVKLSSAEKAEFLTPEREAFVRDAVVALAGRGLSRIYMLRLDGRPVAASLNFRHGDRSFGYNSGYDPAYRSLAVGLLNHALSLEKVIEQGVRYFDFMRGDEPYKYDLGAMDREIHHVIARR
ncbi:MAG: GNAT family N-acetyltransferase [Chloroflexi bacterium]|nr:GNAT family N-acetyltransferase [Chloroflexota bacterium]